MPIMTYQDQIGKDFSFDKGSKVPQWLFTGDCTFGTDVTVVALKTKVYMFGKITEDTPLIVVKSKKPVNQTCPTISWFTIDDPLVGMIEINL